MTDRVSIHSTPEELAARLQLEPPPDSTCLATYNLSPPGSLLVVLESAGERVVRRVSWRDPDSTRTSVALETAREELVADRAKPVLLPLSGFYLWKTSGERADHPFYVRPQREAFLVAGGVLYLNDREEPVGVLPIHQPANALIRPLDHEMIWAVPDEKFSDWLEGDWTPDLSEERSIPGLGITEWTVHRVGPGVNEVDRDGEELVQPLPK